MHNLATHADRRPDVRCSRLLGPAGVGQTAPAADARAGNTRGPTGTTAQRSEIARADGREGSRLRRTRRLRHVGSHSRPRPTAGGRKLAHYARFALEANPDPAVDELLRKSLDQLKGNLLIGVINSIGVRRDGQAVPALATRLTDENVEVAAAAAHALGCMATAAASDGAVRRAGVRHRAAADGVGRGCLVCAERLLEAGSREQAMPLYDLVRAADLAPVIRLRRASRRLLARGSDGIPLLVEQLRSDDPAVVETALARGGELPSPDVVPALLGSLGQLPPASVAGVLLALGDLGDAQATSVVTAALAADVLPVRLAAIHSLRKIGDADAIPPLWQIAIGPDPQWPNPPGRRSLPCTTTMSTRPSWPNWSIPRPRTANWPSS